MTLSTLDQVRYLVGQLSSQDRLYLLSDITTLLIQETVQKKPQVGEPLPLLHGVWSDDIPMCREDLYDDQGR